jgi:hypothetical protein
MNTYSASKNYMHNTLLHYLENWNDVYHVVKNASSINLLWINMVLYVYLYKKKFNSVISACIKQEPAYNGK